MKRLFFAPLIAAAITLIGPGSALADFPHVVQRGETLTSVAAADGLTLAALAAANGISPEAQLVAGSVIEIPPQGSPAQAGSTQEPAGGANAPSASLGGSYVVRPGDTLTAIAARQGTTVGELAALNGLSPNGVLLSGSALVLPAYGSGGTATASSAAPASEPDSQGSGGPYPTAQRVSGGQIGTVADVAGVPAAFAQAIGWQESGWNNDEVSGAGAVGVMQIIPGTWDWIQRSLAAGTSLSPYSAIDNVRGGVLYLRSLLDETGSEELAAASYYQGLASVRAHGMYPSTRQYVTSVMSLEQHFGG